LSIRSRLRRLAFQRDSASEGLAGAHFALNVGKTIRFALVDDGCTPGK
jgi:hypothetical protein